MASYKMSEIDDVQYEDHWFELSREDRLQWTAQKVYKKDYDDIDPLQKKILRGLDIKKVSQKLKTGNQAIPLVTLQGASQLFYHKDFWDLPTENKKCINQWLIKSSDRYPTNYDVILRQIGANWLASQSEIQLKSIKKLPNLAISKRFFSAKYLELSDFECNAIDDFKKAINEKLSTLSTAKNEPSSNVPKSPTKSSNVPNTSNQTVLNKANAMPEGTQSPSICADKIMIKTEPQAPNEQLEPENSHQATVAFDQEKCRSDQVQKQLPVENLASTLSAEIKDRALPPVEKKKDTSLAQKVPSVRDEPPVQEQPPVQKEPLVPVDLPVRHKLPVPEKPVIEKPVCEQPLVSVEPPVKEMLPVREGPTVQEKPLVEKPPVREKNYQEKPPVSVKSSVPEKPPGQEKPAQEEPLVSVEPPVKEKPAVQEGPPDPEKPPGREKPLVAVNPSLREKLPVPEKRTVQEVSLVPVDPPVPEKPTVRKEPLVPVGPPAGEKLLVPEQTLVSLSVEPPVKEKPAVREKLVQEEPPVAVDPTFREEPPTFEKSPAVEESPVVKEVSSIGSNSNFELHQATESASLPKSPDATPAKKKTKTKKVENKTVDELVSDATPVTKSNAAVSAEKHATEIEMCGTKKSSEEASVGQSSKQRESRSQMRAKHFQGKAENQRIPKKNLGDSAQSGSKLCVANEPPGTAGDLELSSEDEKSSTERAVKESRHLLKAYKNIESLPVEPKAPFDQIKCLDFDEKLLTLKGVLVDYIRFEALDIDVDPLQINHNNALRFGKMIKVIKLDLCSIENLIREEVYVKHVLNEMDSITNKIRLKFALSKHLKNLKTDRRSDDYSNVQLQIREVNRILATGKTHNIRNSHLLTALEEAFDVASKTEYRTSFAKLWPKEKKKIMKSFGICENHGLQLAMQECAFLFFGYSQMNSMSNHAVICLKMLRNLLCNTSHHTDEDWIKVKNENIPNANNLLLEKYAALRRLQFKDFHRVTRSVEPYMTFKEVCTLRMTFLSFYHGRLKHITICKATATNHSKGYFNALYQFRDDHAAMKCLEKAMKNTRKTQKSVPAASSAKPCEKIRENLSGENNPPIDAKETAASAQPEGNRSPDIEHLQEQARILQEQLEKLRLAKLEMEKSLLKAAEQPIVQEFEECGMEEVSICNKEFCQKPYIAKPEIIQSDSEPNISNVASLDQDFAPAGTIAHPENVSDVQAASLEISDEKVSSSKDDVETCNQQPIEEQMEAATSNNSSHQENQKDLSEGECSSSSDSENCAVIKSAENPKKRKSSKTSTCSASSNALKRHKIDLESDIRQDVADLASCLALKKLDRAADILFSKKYAELTSQEKVRVDKFSRNYDINDQQMSEAALSLSAAANSSPSKQNQFDRIASPPVAGAESPCNMPQYVPPPQPLPPGVESSQPKKLQPSPPQSSPPTIMTKSIVPVPLPLHLISTPPKPAVAKTSSSDNPAPLPLHSIPLPAVPEAKTTGPEAKTTGSEAKTAESEAKLISIHTESPNVNVNFCCHRCGQSGHKAPECPIKKHPMMSTIPRSTGIPSTRLISCYPNSPGAMLSPTGRWVRENVEGISIEEPREEAITVDNCQESEAENNSKEPEAVAVKVIVPEEPPANHQNPCSLSETEKVFCSVA